jgi:damage-control phosphatase, subfamily I
MKVQECCRNCLKGLARKTVNLSADDEALCTRCFDLIDNLFAAGYSPPGISNKVLAFIKRETGAYDPYEETKAKELLEARRALGSSESQCSGSLEDALLLSAIGNSMDFFLSGGYESDELRFEADLDKIEEEIYISSNEALVLGDNIGDFVFDAALVKFLEGIGKTVFYAVKEHPVQNDISLYDVEKLGLGTIYRHTISTGTAEVGIRRKEMAGKVKEIWDNSGLVIAKGMGNYETMSEYGMERPVIHIMKVKCPAVADAVQRPVGTYIAMTGGEKNG